MPWYSFPTTSADLLADL
jgi:hypothetical protein